MLRNACGRSHVFKAFSSSLTFEHVLAAANSSNAAANSANVANASNSNDSSIKSELPLRTLNDELHDAESKYIKPLIHVPGLSTSTGSTSKIREYLKNGQYIKLLIRLSVDNHLNDEYISSLFSTGGLTKSEYSLFINKLLSERELNIKLSNVIADTPHTELIYKLYEFYRDHVVDEHDLNPLQLYDLSVFLKTFITEAQLSKAHNILDFILSKRPLDRLLANGDVEILIQFLRLKCGALSKFWKVQPASQKNTTGVALAQKSSNSRLAKNYKFQNEKVLLQIINTVLSDPNWKNKRSASLDATIVYSLGYLGQTDLIEKYVNHTWSPSNKAADEINPNSELLIAVLTSYCVKEGNMRKGLELLDKFTSNYPETELDHLFWRRLLQLSSLLWDQKKDRKATLSHGCWTIMKQWHTQRQRKIPYDYGIIKELYPIFVRTKNQSGALEILTKSFLRAFIQPEFTMLPNELSLLRRYQKFILKMIALKGNYHKGFEFCQEWSLNSTNNLELKEYFMKWRNVYEHKCMLKSKQSAALQEKYDEMEEEDMLLGRLW